MEAYPVEFGHVSHTGMRRANNQDNWAAVPAATETQFHNQGHVFLVADGMGGHLGGEKASELAVQVVPLTYAKNIQQGPAVALRMGLQEANATINRRGNEAIHFYNMGTTCSVLALREDEAWVGHVGDSRIYRIRAKNIDQITFDHSFLWETARLRKVAPEQVKDVMQNKIMRCLGPDQVVEVDIEGPHPLRPGDTFLLCSDGLSGPVGDVEIAQAAWLLPPKEACAFLASLANLRGGPDNITVQVVKLPGRPAQDLDQHAKGLGFFSNLKSILPWLLAPGLALAAMFVWQVWDLISQGKKDLDGLKIATLVGATSLTIGGLVGLVLKLLSGKSGEEAAVEPAKAKIHRRESWKLSPDFIQALVSQADALVQAGKDLPAMQATLPEINKGLQSAKRFVTESAWPESFRAVALIFPKLEPVIRASLGKQIAPVPMVVPRTGQKT